MFERVRDLDPTSLLTADHINHVALSVLIVCVYVCVFKLDCTYQFNFIPPSAHFFPLPRLSSVCEGLLGL